KPGQAPDARSLPGKRPPAGRHGPSEREVARRRLHRKNPASATPRAGERTVGFLFETGPQAAGTAPDPMMAKLAVYLIRFYQIAISPYFPPSCRYTPSCSQYGIEAFRKHGFFRGLLLTVRRIGRCHPWSAGGYDP